MHEQLHQLLHDQPEGDERRRCGRAPAELPVLARGEDQPLQSPAAFFQIDPNPWTNANPQNKGLYRGLQTTDAQGKASFAVALNTLRFKDDPGTATFLICPPLSAGPYFATFEALYERAN
jgi:hypothetical protein